MRNDFTETLKLLSEKELHGDIDWFERAVKDYLKKEKIALVNDKIFLDEGLSDDVVKKFLGQGFYDVSFPKKAGGVELGGGHPYAINALVHFLTSGVCPDLGLISSVRNTSFQTVLMSENEELIEKYVKGAMDNNKCAGFVLTEPEHGTDATRIVDTKAIRDGKDYIIEGKKEFISNSGPMTEFYVVFANVEDKGITPFIVDGDSKEIGIRPYTAGGGKLGFFGSNTAALEFNGVRIPEKNRLGEEGRGWEYIRSLTTGRLDMAIIAAALTISAQEEAVLQSAGPNARKVFGKKIGEYQGVTIPLAENQGVIDSMLYSICSTAIIKDKVPGYFPEAAVGVKTYVTEAAVECISKALKVFGGAGFMEYRLNQYWRAAQALTHTEGETLPLLNWRFDHCISKDIYK